MGFSTWMGKSPLLPATRQTCPLKSHEVRVYSTVGVTQRHWKQLWIMLLRYWERYSCINKKTPPRLTSFASHLGLLAYRRCCTDAKSFLVVHSNVFRFHVAFLGHHILLSRLSESDWKEETICVRDDSSNGS